MKKKTNYPGVRTRPHANRKHGVQRDKCFFIRYRVDGKLVEESVGWASQGMTADKASRIRSKLVSAAKQGEGARTLAEKRKLRDDKARSDAAKAITLNDFWPRYFKHAQATKKATSAYKEESHFRLWLSPHFGNFPIRQIGMNQWDALVELLDKAGKSPRTKEYITGTLRRILKFAYHRRLIAKPPPAGKRIGVTGPGSSNRRLRVITPAEAEAILTELERFDIHAWRITRFAFLTGCRASEAFNLRWRDVDYSLGTVTFPETKNRDTRTLPLTPPLRILLDPKDMGNTKHLVFTKKNGAPYDEAPSSFKKVVNKILRLNEGRSKRDRISFHSIRHSVATNLAKTLNLRDLMDVMGWRTVQMAMRYVKGDEKSQLHALSGLGNILTTKKSNVVNIRRDNMN